MVRSEFNFITGKRLYIPLNHHLLGEMQFLQRSLPSPITPVMLVITSLDLLLYITVLGYKIKRRRKKE